MTTQELAEHITNWHSEKIQLLRHLATIPSGAHVEAKVDGQHQLMTLEGDLLKGFVLGLNAAIEALGALPFGDDPNGSAQSTGNSEFH